MYLLFLIFLFISLFLTLQRTLKRELQCQQLCKTGDGEVSAVARADVKPQLKVCREAQSALGGS